MITREEDIMQLSARNQIPGRVTSITIGEANANVHLDANGVALVPPSPSRPAASSA